MSSKRVFENGSSIEWVDKETIKYIEGSYSVLVWVDFEAGFFSLGRVIKASSIKSWDSWPEGESELIDERKKQEIIEKVKQFFGKNCREETENERVEREKTEATNTSKKVFEDGSWIEPISRELDRYTENGFSTTVKVVYKSGILSDKWVIKASSIKSWDTMPDGFSDTIDEHKKQEIIQKIQSYYKSLQTKYRVEIDNE